MEDIRVATFEMCGNDALLTDIAAVQLRRVLLPCPGLSVRLKSGQRGRYGLALSNPIYAR